MLALLCAVAMAGEVVLSTGLGGWSTETLQGEFDSYQQYANAKSITGASVLLYGLRENGSMFWWNTSSTWTSKQFQQDLKTKLGLKAYPCLYCDATIGNCAPLGPRVKAMIEHKEAFISFSIAEAIEYGWDGYAVDFESFGPMPDASLNDFVIEWGERLHQHDIDLQIWVGGDTAFDLKRLNASVGITSIITMNSYYFNSLDSFVHVAQSLFASVSPAKAGFGLLSPASLRIERFVDSNVMTQVGQWCRNKGVGSLSVWASHIPSTWMKGLASYLGNGARF